MKIKSFSLIDNVMYVDKMKHIRLQTKQRERKVTQILPKHWAHSVKNWVTSNNAYLAE